MRITKGGSFFQYAHFFLRWVAKSGYVNCENFEKLFAQNVSLDTQNAVLTNLLKVFSSNPENSSLEDQKKLN